MLFRSKAAKSLQALHDYELRIIDLFGKMPKEVKQLFKQRQLDLFVNEEGVDSMRETTTHVVIKMTPEWSSRVDGAKLFTAMSALSKKISLKLKDRRIEITLEKKSKYLDLLLKVIDLLTQASKTMMRKENE